MPIDPAATKAAYLAGQAQRAQLQLARIPVATVVSFLEALGYTVTPP